MEKVRSTDVSDKQRRLRELNEQKSSICFCSECGKQLQFRSFSVHPCFRRAVSQHGKYRARQLVRRRLCQSSGRKGSCQNDAHHERRRGSLAQPHLTEPPPPPTQHCQVTLEVKAVVHSEDAIKRPPVRAQRNKDRSESKKRPRSVSPPPLRIVRPRTEELTTLESAVTLLPSSFVPFSHDDAYDISMAQETTMHDELFEFGMSLLSAFSASAHTNSEEIDKERSVRSCKKGSCWSSS